MRNSAQLTFAERLPDEELDGAEETPHQVTNFKKYLNADDFLE